MRSLLHLNKYFLKYKWRLLLGILFAVFSTFFGIYVAVLVREAADFMTEAVEKNYSFDMLAAGLLKYGMLILGTTVVSGIFMFLMRQAIIVMSRHIEYDLKNEIFAHYQRLDMAFYRRNSTGDLMNRISEDVSRVRMYIGPAVMYFAGTLSTLILVSATMTHVNLTLTLYVLAPLPVLAVAIYYVSNLINRMSARVQEQLSRLSSIAQESFSGIRVLKAYAQEEPIGKYFSAETEGYRKRHLSLIKTEALFSPFILLLMGASTILTIYIGGKQAIAGQISYGNIAEFIIYITKLTWPVASLGWVTSLVQRAAASQQRINEFLKTEPGLNSPKDIPAVILSGNGTSGSIEFRNVSFIYPDSGIQALENISFTAKADKPLAIIGRTGSGKSTIAALICRMYDVSKGEILVNGVRVKEWNLSALRGLTGYVPQDTFLFSDTIENNIAFGISSVKKNGLEPVPAEVQQAARMAGLEKEIERFPGKYQTLLGERGITLSGGQKQRVAIARAIIGNPKILVFDDCLSAVDTETEAGILNNLREIMRGKITILISHRVSTVKDAAHILVLDNAKIIEEGNHASLLKNKGVYFGLYQKQLYEKEKITE